MGATTKIAWTHHTFNPWWGCEKVSTGCANCYAESFAKRTGHAVWGASSPRRFFGDAHWREPLKWEAAAARAAVRCAESGLPPPPRPRVFCASMADVFEDRADLVGPRFRLFTLVERTPSLDWLLLTKRPENINRLRPERREWPNVWLGFTAENDEWFWRRLAHADRCQMTPALWFVSAEPLVGAINFKGSLGPDDLRFGRDKEIDPLHGIVGWVIVGGESGPGARPCDVAWIRDVVEQCKAADVPVFVKQFGANAVRGETSLRLRDPKGGDPEEWWPDLRVREFPR